MTDAEQHSAAFRDAVAELGARQKSIKPLYPWQNGAVERFNRTRATEWASRHPFTSYHARSDALVPWIEHDNTGRTQSRHGLTPAARRSPT